MSSAVTKQVFLGVEESSADWENHREQASKQSSSTNVFQFLLPVLDLSSCPFFPKLFIVMEFIICHIINLTKTVAKCHQSFLYRVKHLKIILRSSGTLYIFGQLQL